MNQMCFDTSVIPPAGEAKSLAESVKNLCEDLLKFRVDIDKALAYSHGSYTYNDVCSGVLAGRYHFYPQESSFLIMELQQFPQYSVYHAFLAGGNLKELVAVQEDIRTIAKKLGAKYASLSGRHGWTKELKKHGWGHTYSIMYTEV